MKTYTLHIPVHKGPPQQVLEGAKLVPEGFSWGAFFFSFLWFWVKGCFLAGFVVVLGFSLIRAGGVALGASTATQWLVALLFQIFIALEADVLLRWTYARNGLKEVSAVMAKNLPEAERNAFRQWLETSEPQRTAFNEPIADNTVANASPLQSTPYREPKL